MDFELGLLNDEFRKLLEKIQEAKNLDEVKEYIKENKVDYIH